MNEMLKKYQSEAPCTQESQCTNSTATGGQRCSICDQILTHQCGIFNNITCGQGDWKLVCALNIGLEVNTVTITPSILRHTD